MWKEARAADLKGDGLAHDVYHESLSLAQRWGDGKYGDGKYGGDGKSSGRKKTGSSSQERGGDGGKGESGNHGKGKGKGWGESGDHRWTMSELRAQLTLRAHVASESGAFILLGLGRVRINVCSRRVLCEKNFRISFCRLREIGLMCCGPT